MGCHSKDNRAKNVRNLPRNEKMQDEKPKRIKRLMKIATKFSTPVPKMIKTIEKAIKDIQELES